MFNPPTPEQFKTLAELWIQRLEKNHVMMIQGSTTTEDSTTGLEVPKQLPLNSPVSKSLSTQVGGSHYKKYKIQPVEYAMANNLNYCQANAVKYTTRYRDKGGREDLEKAIHNLQILIELEYGSGKAS